jgi:hypothetical protein
MRLPRIALWIIILVLALALATALMIYHWVTSGVTTVREIASFYASVATIIGVIWAIINVRRALLAYENEQSMRRKEVISKLYERFLEEDVYELYEKIKNKEPFELTTRNEKALNKVLTLFDEIDYFKTKKLFGDEIWEYIACELINLSCHENVQDFLKKNRKKYPPKLQNQYQKDLMPFTGFKALVKELPKDYWFREKPNLEEDDD